MRRTTSGSTLKGAAVEGVHILTTETVKTNKNSSARAFIHSLNILVKYVRLYGLEHKRTFAQFDITWTELQLGLPRGGEGGLLLGVANNQLLLDGVALETGQAESSFAHLLTSAGLASIHFSSAVTREDFSKLVRAFALAGSRARDLVSQIKDIFGDSKQATIRINEVKFIASDPANGEVSIAAQLTAQALGPEFKHWLNDPQKLLQLIAAAEGARSGGGPRNDSSGSNPSFSPGTSAGSLNKDGTTRPKIQTWSAGVVPLQEEEVVQAIRLLTRFGEASKDKSAKPGTVSHKLNDELSKTDENTKVNLQQLLENLAATVPSQQNDTPLLMKAAEHLAIRFALERFRKGDVKVDAVHQMLEQMSKQMDALRGVLQVQEEKMSKAGILVESHADILDRMFWAEVPDSGKKSVLMSDEAACVPARNVRQFVELLLASGDTESASSILRNYFGCLDAGEAAPRRKTATGLSQLADLFAALGADLLGPTIRKVGETLGNESDPELQSLLNAAFVRLSAEACNRRLYGALIDVCSAMDSLAEKRPVLAAELRPRVGVDNRLPEFIEEAMCASQIPRDLLLVLRSSSQVATEHLADRFFRCMRRDECDRVVEITKELGAAGLHQLREMLRVGPDQQATAVVGLLSRLDVPTLLELLPQRLPALNRFYQDVVVRQIAYGSAPDRGRTLLELIEFMDPLVVPQALDEIGMSGDHTAAPPLIVMAQAGDTDGRSPLLQVKAVESLGRLRVLDCVPVLRNLLETKKRWKWAHHRELRIAAAQALAKIDPSYRGNTIANNGLDASELALDPLDSAPACPWVRQRRYERTALPKPLAGTISSSWGKSRIALRELSIGGGMGTKNDNLRVGSEANLEIAVGMKHIRAQVLLRRARVDEVGFEIVNIDLESRYRLRRLILESASKGQQGSGAEEWVQRKL
ncbi:MAG: hypothetical protein QOD84_200 [Acidobacteriaceae bacterium]